MSLTHWKKLENPDYIGAYAFAPNEEKTVTIRAVERKIVTGAEGKKEECTVVSFVEKEKPLILNVTNAKMIEKHAGTPYIERWGGVRIILVVERVKAFGDVVDAVRVSKKKPTQKAADAPQSFTCTDCSETITDETQSMSAAALAAYSKKKFGVVVCTKCGTKRAEAQKAGAAQ